MNEAENAQDFTPAPSMTEQQRVTYTARLRAARRARGLSQDEVAERAGVSRNTVGNAESGKVLPQSAVLWRIMGALDLRPDPGREWSPEVEGWLRMLAPLIEQLDADARERVMLDVLGRVGDAVRSTRAPHRHNV